MQMVLKIFPSGASVALKSPLAFFSFLRLSLASVRGFDVAADIFLFAAI